MHVLLINGSPRSEGCTFTALTAVANTLTQEGITSEIIQLGTAPIRDCIACDVCKTLDNRCVFADDVVNEIIQKADKADGFVFGSPVYFAHPTGRILSVLDRVFRAGRASFVQKPAMSVVSARRAGTTATIDALNKYFTLSQMPVISSSYWNMVHGNTPQEVLQDKEGIQTMENAARNMAWILKCIEAGKTQGIQPPQADFTHRTNFIH